MLPIRKRTARRARLPLAVGIVFCLALVFESTALGLPERTQQMAPSLPIGRAGAPEEIAEAILWLLSGRASYTTGATLRVAGGR